MEPAESNVLSTGEKHLEALQIFEDHETLSVAYSALSDETRYLIWEAKLARAAEDSYFTEIQRKLINEIRSQISVKNFEESDEREIFKNVWLPKWMDENKSKFRGDDLYLLLFTLKSTYQARDFVTTTGSEEDCHCSVGSNWTCYGGHGYWGNCLAIRPCVISLKGCGSFLDDTCDGSTCSGAG